MKKHSMKMLSLLMALIIAASACAVSALAAEDMTEPQTVSVDTADIAEDTFEPAVTGAEPETQPTEAPTQPETQPETQPATEAAPTVGRVTNLERTSFESDSVTLTWDKVSGADGYYIYYLNADKHKNYSRYGSSKTNTFTVRDINHTTKYYFWVSAYVIKDGVVYEGEKTQKQTATQPAAVTGLTKWRSSNVLEMTWDSNPRATGYRIYRTEQGGREVLYKTVYGSSKTTFDDYSVKSGKTYTYRVKSFRELYGTSYSSDAARETFIAGMCAPDYTITSRCQRVNITWNRVPYATHYEVYYSTSSNNSSFVKLFTTPRLYYNTTKLTNGKTYYFRILPIYQSGSTRITGTSLKKSSTITASAYGKSTGSTYIEICIAQQHMWVYKNGTQIASTDVVTGNAGDCDTPKGYYDIDYKAYDTYLYGPGYASHVYYWMPFYGGYGIHDSAWRSSYGGSIYRGNGSHGCVNTPYGAMSKIYNNISSGTPVIIY